MTEAILLRIELHDEEQARAILTRTAHPWIKEQLRQGRELVAEFREIEDDLTERQRRYYWGVVLQEVAEGIVVGGARYTKDAWHEYGKREFLPRKTKRVKVAGRARPVVTTVIASTNDLSIRRMGEYLERWMAFAAEHGITVSEPLPPELRGTRARARAMEQGNVDKDTGEITEGATT
jgi:hypothetical protein